jgi:hypothetical protein
VTDQINVTPDVYVEVSMSHANLTGRNSKKLELENKCLTDLFLDFLKKNKIQKNQDFTWFPVLICCLHVCVLCLRANCKTRYPREFLAPPLCRLSHGCYVDYEAFS